MTDIVPSLLLEKFTIAPAFTILNTPLQHT